MQIPITARTMPRLRHFTTTILYSTELQLFWRILTFLITVPYKYSYLLTDEILVDKYLWQFYGKINIYGSSMEKYVQTMRCKLKYLFEGLECYKDTQMKA